MSYPPSALVKYFKDGEHVKILEGKYGGETGTIVKIENRIATLILDNVKQEIRVMVNNLKLSNEVNSETTKNLDLDLRKFDLVKLTQFNSCGVILRIQKENVTIIDENGQMQNISYFGIDKKINDKNVSVQNTMKHIITIDATVKVLDGINKGKTGIVKHIFKETLFLYDNEFHASSVSNNINNKSNFVQYVQNKDKDKKENLIGKICTVMQGSWKGYQGTVKDEDDKTIRLELFSKCKIITLPRNVVHPVGEKIEDQDKFFSGGKTPMIYQGAGGRTSYNPQSPWIGQPSPGPGYFNSPGPYN